MTCRAGSGSAHPWRTLAELLNDNGYRWGDGRTYQGGRGTYGLISATWKWALEHRSQDAADAVAETFVAAAGDYAWERTRK
jgi:hypothetical protein